MTLAPTPSELLTCSHIDLTSKCNWNPTQITLGQRSTSPGKIAETEEQNALSNACPCAILLTGLRSVNLQVTRSECDATLEDIPSRKSRSWSDRHSKVSAEVLAGGFAISIDRATVTLKVTHQKGTRSAILPLIRRCRADRQHLGTKLNSEFATDTLNFKRRSLTGDIGSQIFSHKSGFDVVHRTPKADDEHTGNALKDFVSDRGAPEHLTMDGVTFKIGPHTTFQKLLRDREIETHGAQLCRPNQNPVKGVIREVKRRWCGQRKASQIASLILVSNALAKQGT